MSLTSIITGRRPRIAVRLAFGQGRRSPAIGRTLAVVAGKSAAGAGTANVVTSIYSSDEASAHFGPGTSGHLQCAAAFDVDAKAKILAVIAADSTATAATFTPNSIAGTATASGTMLVRFADCILPVTVTNTDTADQVGAAILAAYAKHPECPVVPTYASPNLTFTSKDKGTQTPQIKWMISDVPAGITFTATSGTLDSAGGANELDWSAAYAALSASGEQVDLIVPATNITAALTEATTGLRDRVVAAAQPGVEKWWGVVLGQTTTYATATTQADSFDLGTVNPATEPGWWFQIVWAKNNYGLPWVVAARAAAARLRETATNINHRWCDIETGYTLAGLTLPVTDADYPTDTEIENCLSNGVTPIAYNKSGGTGYIVWPVTTKHVTGGAADFRASETNVPDTTVYAARYLKTMFADQDWEFGADDNADGSIPDTLAAQTVTPSMAKSYYLAVYKGPELAKYLDQTYRDDGGVLHDVDDLVDAQWGSGVLDVLGPILVKRWLRAIGLDLREYGTG